VQRYHNGIHHLELG